ncbi:putative ribonuclease H-like domain-containing protein, partial [Tanacetum coccineum]
MPNRKRAIGTKWVFRNKKDKRGIVIKNKARLVAQGHTQEEGIDYDEVFAPVARIEAIRLFLAYASFKDFVVYQMDVKSAFLYGKIEEGVYVCQPPRFEDLKFPDKVYKVEKTLYGLHQAPKAWYETFSTYLLDNGFQRGMIDKILFIKRYKGDILLVQVCVDDIIFGSTKKELCIEFEKLMHKRLQMNSMGELTFFLGLQVKQKKDDVDGKDVDVHLYRSIIGSLMYITSSRPDIMFVVCACARYQVTPKESHLHAVKRIFRKCDDKFVLMMMYNLISDLYALPENPIIYVSHIEQFWSTAKIRTLNNGEQEIHAKVDGKSKVITGVSGSGNIHKTSSISHDSLPRGDTLESDEDSMKLILRELMETCTLLKRKVHTLEKKTKDQASEILSLKETTTSQAAKIIGLKKRVNKLEEDAIKQGRGIEEIDQDKDITLVSPTHVSDQDN